MFQTEDEISGIAETSVNYPTLKDGACDCAKNRVTIGWLTSALKAMFIAAMWSAAPAKPQDTCLNSSLVGRLALATWPQEGQVREVFRGSTKTTGTLAILAL